MKRIFDDVKSHPIDPEEMALFHNIHKTQVMKHLARGFTILSEYLTRHNGFNVKGIKHFFNLYHFHSHR